MSVSIREFMTSRRAELLATIKAARVELAQLDAVEDALDAADNAPARPRRERGSPGSGKKTLKELALEALRQHPDGMEAVQIIAWIKERHGIEIARESMSPQLSRLGHEGAIGRFGLIWRLAPGGGDNSAAQAQNDETPDAGTSDASVEKPFSFSFGSPTPARSGA